MSFIVEVLRNTRISHNSNLPIEVKHVEKERSSLQIFLQNTSLKKKMQKTDEKQLGSKVKMQKITLQVKVN